MRLCVRNTECAQLHAVGVNTSETNMLVYRYCMQWHIVKNDNHLAVRSLFDAAYTQEVVLSYKKNKNKKQSVIRLKLSPPPLQWC